MNVSALSCFQTLPVHIVSDILDYARLSSDSAFDLLCAGSSISESCRLWRQVAVKESLRTQTLEVITKARSENAVILDSSAPYHANCAEPPHSLARTLRVRFRDMTSILDGSFLSAIASHQEGYGDVCYANARGLVVEIAHAGFISGCNVPCSDSLVMAMAADAARAIRMLIPAASALSASVSKECSASYGTWSVETSIGALLSELAANISVVRIDYDSSLQFVGPAMAFTKGLTHLSMTFPVSAELLSQIVQRNAETLQHLHIQNLHPELARALVSDSCGQPLVYPNLEHLRFSQHAIFGSVALPEAVSSCGAPFPRLESLVVENSYMFTNDLVFRAAYGHLRRLCLPLTPRVIKIVSQSPGFRSKAKTEIRHLLLETSIFNHDLAADYTVQATRLALDIISASSSTIQTLYLLNDFDKHMVMQAIRSEKTMTATAGFHSLTKLCCRSLALDLADVTSMLLNTPRLRNLECSLAADSLDPHNAESIERMVTYYSSPEEVFPLNKWFSSWHVVGCGNAKMANIACAALLVALSCPRLSTVTHSPLFKQEFNDQMRELLQENGLFGRYKHQLWHLVSHQRQKFSNILF
ncbi:hypothetical protein H4R99_000667 [Coemansia sp. RSA 1722]|nr:hypothetical protein IWW45_000552 [Coemansia sp. RSA 485]KAJ2606114.1 hypothetical protein H4R99_000667 [Coemansia sp. RSA 1722]